MRELVVYNPKTDQIGEMFYGWFGFVILTDDIPGDAPMSEYKDSCVFDDEPEFNEFNIVGVL